MAIKGVWMHIYYAAFSRLHLLFLEMSQTLSLARMD